MKSRRNPLVATIAALSLTWSIASSLAIYPNCVSYFNELAGGPRHGHLYLGSSCTDWGQDLFLLKQWHDQHPAARPLFVAYEIPLIDPSLVGIESQAVPFGPEYKNAATLPQESLGPRAGWYVLSINKLRTVNEEYTYLKQFEPVDRVGYSFVVFHITPEAAAEYRAEGRLPLRQ